MNVLVPGQLLSAPFPNHIVLNTLSKEAGWETSSREWIPEDGLYNRLVVKFPFRHGQVKNLRDYGVICIPQPFTEFGMQLVVLNGK